MDYEGNLNSWLYEHSNIISDIAIIDINVINTPKWGISIKNKKGNIKQFSFLL